MLTGLACPGILHWKWQQYIHPQCQTAKKILGSYSDNQGWEDHLHLSSTAKVDCCVSSLVNLPADVYNAKITCSIGLLFHYANKISKYKFHLNINYIYKHKYLSCKRIFEIPSFYVSNDGSFVNDISQCFLFCSFPGNHTWMTWTCWSWFLSLYSSLFFFTKNK